MPWRAMWKGRLCFSYFLPSRDLLENKQEKPVLYIGETRVSRETAWCAGALVHVNCSFFLLLGLVLFCQSKLELCIFCEFFFFFPQD